MKLILFFSLFSFICLPLFSKEDKYIVLGRVTQENIKNPIENVAIYSVGNNKFLGTTDVNGEFKIEIKAGRQILQFVLIGYQPIIVEVDVRSIVEYLSISLETSSIDIDDVMVIGSKAKQISAERFNPEQASRYAGSLGDPARMVRSFAGVQVLNDSRNDIIVRGNSPIGLQWRVDGFEIPNPNHHGGMGLTGSVVTLLNTNLLTNSDFYLGGWGANFSNATSGIFDLKMRGGDDIKKELYWSQVGWNGIELGAEGNFDKDNKSSYMVDYRYSFLGIMERLGMDIGVTPEYQDFTFKTTTQVGNNHTLSLLGIFGKSNINVGNGDEFTNMSEIVKTGSGMIFTGITHEFKIKDNQFLTSKLSFIENKVNTNVEDGENSKRNENIYGWNENSTENKYSFFSEYLLRFKADKIFTAGLNIDVFDVNYNERWENKTDSKIISDEDGSLSLIRAFAQYQTSITGRVKTTVGVNTSYLTLNGSYSIEPRLSFKYSFNSKKSISFATGSYSQMQPRPIYFTRNSKNGVDTNKDLKFSKNIQAILSYNWALNYKWHLKAEAYYQYLYDIPVVNNPNSTISLINVGADYYIPRYDSLVNKGNGENYGFELTIERYFQNNFYLLMNGSLYRSKYSNGFNEIKYSTCFDGNYSFNLTGGYELRLNKSNQLLFDLKFSYAGGKRYTPIDNEASKLSGKEVFDYNRTNSKQLSSYTRADFKISYRVNALKFMCDFSIDLQNFTNQKNPYLIDYTFKEGDIEQIIYNQQGFIPMVTFKIIW